MVSRHARGLSSLTGATHLRFSDAPPDESAALTRAGDLEVQVELDDPSLLGEEQKRLAKVLAKLEKDLEFNAKRLDNPEFSRRARPEVVAAEREKRERLQEELQSTRERLDRLSALTRGSG
jgi:valyl-tRNA synthetase